MLSYNKAFKYVTGLRPSTGRCSATPLNSDVIHQVMTDDEIKLWSTSYIEAQKDHNVLVKLGIKHPHWWAVEKFMNTGVSDKHSDLDHWNAILQILALDPPEEIYGVMAAGPLEDFIDDFGVKYIDKIEHEAKFNLRFRQLLGGVWKRSTPEVWARIERVRGKAW